jgi:hypothetical protein
MKKQYFNRHRILLAFATLSVVMTIALSISAVVSIATARPSDSAVNKQTNPAEPPVAIQEPRDLTALVFAVRPTGFDPDELTISSGRYLIVVQNRSRLRDLTFRFDRENGERLHEVRPQGLNWKRQFELQPGKYVLSEASHPEWHCVIHVIAR